MMWMSNYQLHGLLGKDLFNLNQPFHLVTWVLVVMHASPSNAYMIPLWALDLVNRQPGTCLDHTDLSVPTDSERHL